MKVTRRTGGSTTRRRTAVLAAVGLAIAGTMAGCGTSAGSESDVAKVGVVLPLSGQLASYGKGARAGIEFVVNDINEHGGIKSLGGRKIKLVVADTATDPSNATTEMRRMIDKEQVSAVLGPISSTVASATAPITERAGVPDVAIETTSVYGTRSFYIVSVEAGQMGEAYAKYVDYLSKDRGLDLKSVVITYPQNDYGEKNSAAAEKSLKAMGYDVLDSIAVDPEISDYTPIMLRVRAKHPDVVVSVLYDRDGILFQQARNNLDYNDPVFVCGIGGCDSQGVWDALGDKVASATMANRTFAESFFSPAAKLPGLQKLLSEAKGKVDVPLDAHFVMGAQAARVIQAALEKAGSTDPEKVNAAMKEINIQAGSDEHYLPTAPDGISYEDGAIAGSVAVFNQWQPDGTQKLVYPPDLAATEPTLK